MEEMPALLWWVGEQAGLSSTSRVHPSHVEVLLVLGILSFYSTAGQPDPEDSCVFGKTLSNVFFRVRSSTAACEGLCHSGSLVRPRPWWQPEYVWLSVCLGQVWASPQLHQISSSLGISGLFHFCHLVMLHLAHHPHSNVLTVREKVRLDIFGKSFCSKWMV